MQECAVEDGSWVWVRESFLKVHQEVPKAWMAITIDAGEANDVHPKDKQTVGYRLAQQALVNTYGRNLVPGGPVYTSMEVMDDRVVIRFDTIGSGLSCRGGNPLAAFAIAGPDRRFVKATARIVGDTVVVSARSVTKPVAVRYAWAANPEDCNLQNKEEFPASPFRTDDWPPSEGTPENQWRN